MASIFSFDPNPPRVNSPWLTPTNTPPPPRGNTPDTPPPELLSEYGVTKLDAEPQEGPMEYKLHLLLRPRRQYRSSSTGIYVAGSQQSRQSSSSTVNDRVPPPAVAPSVQYRQNRLEHLTTQLLWRLQQSSPYHTSTTNDLVLPKLPETVSELASAVRPTKLMAGLEQSQGALYEIGVTDDGTFVGLTEDEMEESLTNLRAMASSLGCNVEILRMVNVGECEWEEKLDQKAIQHCGQLWVAEALVKPDLSLVVNGHGKSAMGYEKSKFIGGDAEGLNAIRDLSIGHNNLKNAQSTLDHSTSPTEQLRITLTGPTTGGKSSLLGTLSTSTLDNGRGSSRLSLLKHRHELASGLTSSVAHEIFGYKNSGETTDVINYASGNVTSWNDIHAAADKGRLVFVSDSAGHPRFRRTTVRGLVGWKPHWTFLCIAADDGESHPQGAGATSTAREIFGMAGAGVDLSKAHLDLCLKLEQPLVIVITKLDLALETRLRQTLSKILTDLKAAGRIPKLLKPDQTKIQFESELGTIPIAVSKTVREIVKTMDSADLNRIVPIIMISSAKGDGVRLMHALLSELPIPPTPTSSDYIGDVLNPEQPQCVFHIEDIYGFPASYQSGTVGSSDQYESGTVVAGYMRFGTLSVGESIVIGPFDSNFEEDSLSPSHNFRDSQAPYGSIESTYGTSLGVSRSHLSSSELTRIASRKALSATISKGEWRKARILSIRNLRLPVQTLEPGKVGTIGIIIDPLAEDEASNPPFEKLEPSLPRIRKGMVLAVPSHHMIKTGHSLQSVTGLTASFEDGDVTAVTPGSLVVIYIASIRATARVLRLTPHNQQGPTDATCDNEDVFGLTDVLDKDARNAEPHNLGQDGVIDVTLELIKHREWVELGSQVLIMPGGGQGLYYGSERGEKGVAGLEGFVGHVIEVID